MRWPLCALALLAAARAEDLPPATTADSDLTEIVIRAREAMFVAPTRRDGIGRIWAPVKLNGRGPFLMVLDTGATRSVITEPIVGALGLKAGDQHSVHVRGVNGDQQVPAVMVDSLEFGDLFEEHIRMPIVATALGGAQGILGTEALVDKRIVVDFRHDYIRISKSHDEPMPRGFIVLPIESRSTGLVMVRAKVGGVPVRAVIDTGAQTTIGNLALRDELRHRLQQGQISRIEDVTQTSREAETYASPPIMLGQVAIRGSSISYSDTNIFKHWKLLRDPAILVGMEAIGLLDTLIIDYRRQEVGVRLRRSAQ